MAGLIFDEATMINGNLFQFENRLKSHMNKYVDGGALLSTYFSQDDIASTVDRGLQNIDQLFGDKSPIWYNRINNLPLLAFTPANPENTEEQQIEDISVEGDCSIAPGTIVPKQFDMFMVNHLKMTALFQVTSVQYDSMKVEGFYKLHYRLYSTSKDTIDKLLSHTHKEQYYTDLNSIGSNMNPIIREDDYILREKIQLMVNQMITSYRALFYNERHNCFLYHDPQTGLDYFDMCGNEFIAKYSLMNFPNCTDVIVLHSKIRDSQFAYFYNNSVYNWIECDCPRDLVQKFYYICNYAEGYPESSFALWGDSDIQVIQPIPTHSAKVNFQEYSFFDETQFQSLLDPENEPTSSELDKLIWKFTNRPDELSVKDIPLTIANTLLASVKNRDVFFYVPIGIYIIRKILMAS